VRVNSTTDIDDIIQYRRLRKSFCVFMLGFGLLISQFRGVDMSSLPTSYRGRVQAQGIDIEQDGGYSHSWARNNPVTDQEGLSFISKIERQCSDSQRTLRKVPFQKAIRFVKNASKSGGVGPEAQPPSFYDPKLDKKHKSVRVDIEIQSGLTFIPVDKVE
jgi:hypothetical protein